MKYRHFFLLLISVMIINSSCSISTDKMQNKDDVITIYLDALTRRDEKEILSLCAPNHVGVEDVVAEKIKKFGGRSITNISIDYAEEINPAHARATIKGMYQEGGTDYSFEDEVFLENIDGTWYIVFGKHEDAIDAPSTLP